MTTKADDDVNPLLLSSVSRLAELRGEAAAILAEIKGEHADDFARIDELNVEANRISTRVGDLLREGRQPARVLGYYFRVDAPTSTKLDVGAMVAKARPLGHLQTLLDVGVLTYAGNAENIERLPGTLRAQYEEFVVCTPATARVYIPDALK
jgi:hypothetical protein